MGRGREKRCFDTLSVWHPHHLFASESKHARNSLTHPQQKRLLSIQKPRGKEERLPPTGKVKSGLAKHFCFPSSFSRKRLFLLPLHYFFFGKSGKTKGFTAGKGEVGRYRSGAPAPLFNPGSREESGNGPPHALTAPRLLIMTRAKALILPPPLLP